MLETRICILYTIIGAALYVIGYFCGASDNDQKGDDPIDKSRS